MSNPFPGRSNLLFPDPEKANSDGFLCWGGDVAPENLLSAYSQGIFPWSGAGEPVTWWSLDPRCVLFLDDFKLPARSARKLRNHPFHITFNTCFKDVLEGCAAPRKDQEGTWLHPELMDSMNALNKMGWAISVEAWQNWQLAGGLYGLGLGKVFCGDSMFHTKPEASRAALAALVEFLKEQGYWFIDCQQSTPHMLAMGAKEIPRREFLKLLAQSFD